MTTLLSYLRLTLFLAGVLVGVQIPGFVDQYGKSLEAHFIESNESMRQFRQDAEKYFDGDIEKLISHYKKNKDPVFTAGGESINSIYTRNIMLRNALKDFKHGSFSSYSHVFLSPVTDIRAEVWRNYTYSVKLDPTAISVGLLSGLTIALITEIFIRGILYLVVLSGKRLKRSGRTST